MFILVKKIRRFVVIKLVKLADELVIKVEIGKQGLAEEIVLSVKYGFYLGRYLL